MSYPEQSYMFEDPSSYSSGGFFGSLVTRSLTENTSLGASPYGPSSYGSSPYGFGPPHGYLRQQGGQQLQSMHNSPMHSQLQLQFHPLPQFAQNAPVHPSQLQFQHQQQIQQMQRQQFIQQQFPLSLQEPQYHQVNNRRPRSKSEIHQQNYSNYQQRYYDPHVSPRNYDSRTQDNQHSPRNYDNSSYYRGDTNNSFRNDYVRPYESNYNSKPSKRPHESKNNSQDNRRRYGHTINSPSYHDSKMDTSPRRRSPSSGKTPNVLDNRFSSMETDANSDVDQEIFEIEMNSPQEQKPNYTQPPPDVYGKLFSNLHISNNIQNQRYDKDTTNLYPTINTVYVPKGGTFPGPNIVNSKRSQEPRGPHNAGFVIMKQEKEKQPKGHT